MQSRSLDPPCGSRPEVLMHAGLPVVQPETLRYSGPSVFSWFFWIGKLAVHTTRRRDFGGCKREDTRLGFTGKKGDVVPRPPAKGFSNYVIGTASQDTRCVKNRPCDQRRSSLASDSGRPGMTGANSMARSTKPLRSSARIRFRHASQAAQSASLAPAMVP